MRLLAISAFIVVGTASSFAVSRLPTRCDGATGVHRTPVVRMGGPSGLPRMPIRAWPLTKKFNPSMGYDERIATLWRDLEITFGMDEDLTFRAVKRLPSLMNPEESSRWVSHHHATQPPPR